MPALNIWIETEKSYSLWRKLNLDWQFQPFLDLEKEAVKLEDLLNTFDLKPNTEIIADYFHMKGLIVYSKGKFHDSIANYEKSLKFRARNTTFYANSIMNIGINYVMLSKVKTALKMYFKALEILEKVGNKTSLAHLYNNIGVCNLKMGKNYDALSFFEKSMAIDKQIGVIPKIANVYQNMAIVYSSQGKYNDALELHHLSFELRKEYGTQEDIGASLAWMGQCHVLKGDFNKARELFEQSLAIKQKIGNDYFTALTLVDLIKLHYLSPNENMRTYMAELKYITSNNENQYLKLLYLLCEGLEFKEQPTFEKIVNAQRDFTQIYESDNPDFDLKYNSLLHLTELKLMEYKLFNSDANLVSLKQNMEKFYELSRISDSVIVHLEALLLDGNINYAEGHFNTALEKIATGIELSEQNGLFYHNRLFTDFRKKITHNLENYRAIVKDSQDILEQVDSTSFDSYLDHVIQVNWSKH